VVGTPADAGDAESARVRVEVRVQRRFDLSARSREGSDLKQMESELLVRWWALEDLNLRPLPRQGTRVQGADLHVCWSRTRWYVTSGPGCRSSSVGSLTRR
jgi:hypothetical protein